MVTFLSVRRRTVALLPAVLLAFIAQPDAAAHDTLVGVIRVNGQALKNAVIWFEARTPAATPSPRVILDQKGLAFSPRVLAVRVGTNVQMPNSDRVFHNVFSFHDGKKFDLGLYPAGSSRVVTFDKPGVSRIFCNIHPTMAAYVVVVDSAHFAVTDEGGGFTVPVLPAGTYTYHLWRASAKTHSGTVTVTTDQPIAIEL